MSNATDPASQAVNDASMSTQTRPEPKVGIIKRLFGFLWWIISGFGLIGSSRHRNKGEEIIVYAVHQSFFLWFMVLAGFIGSYCVHLKLGSPVMWGWVYLWVVLYTLITLVFDVNTTKFMLWLGVFAFIWLGARYLQDLKHLPALSNVLRYFANLKPELSPGFATAISWLLLPCWIGSLFHTFSQGRKTFTPNSIEETHLGHGCEIIDRSGLKFRRRYRDWFETILGLGACDLEAIDGAGHVIKRWENILFLAFRWNHLDEILHQRAAVMEASIDEDPDKNGKGK